MFELIRTDNPELANLEALNTAILEMQEAMKDKVYDLSNPKGKKVATTDRSKLLKIRTGTEKTRNELNRPHIDGKRLIDRIAKNITAAVVEVEGPLVEIIRADDERKAKIKAEKEEKERKRKADIQDVIHKIADAPSRMGGMDSEQLSVAFASMIDYDVDDSFMEFGDQARAALSKATEEVSDLLAAAIKREEEDAARKAEDERLKKQKEDLDRRQAEIEAQEKQEPVTQMPTAGEMVEALTDGKVSAKQADELFDKLDEAGKAINEPKEEKQTSKILGSKLSQPIIDELPEKEPRALSCRLEDALKTAVEIGAPFARVCVYDLQEALRMAIEIEGGGS